MTIIHRTVTSQSNPSIKAAKALMRRRQRERSNSFLIEGARFVSDALRAKAVLETVFFTEDLLNSPHWESLERDAEVGGRRPDWVLVTEEIMAQLSQTRTPQGVVAVAQLPDLTLDSVLDVANPLILIADRIQDPGNFGTMIRTAAAAGCAGVILMDGTVDAFSAKVLRSTMGAVFRIPVISHVSVAMLRDFLEFRGYQMVVGDLGGRPYYEVDYIGPTAIVVGNEGAGPEPEISETADFVVEIPLANGVESLNAASAAAILVYESVRQRTSQSAQ